jgi:hypothetical protein
MADESDPPRRHYGFKPREFERANDVPALDPEAPRPDPGITAAPFEKIDVHDLIRAGAGTGPQLGSNGVKNRENEIHAILKDNYAQGLASGQFKLSNLNDGKRRRRIRRYWLVMAALNTPLALFWWYVGTEALVPFIFALSGVVMISAKLTWETFFLRTHY